MTISLQEIKKHERTLLATLTEGEATVGRDEEKEIVLSGYSGVSSEHGKFQNHRGDWFYIDLGSTNGSWLNTEEVIEGEINLLRNGDLVQIADAAVQVNLENPSKDSFVIVFEAGEYVNHFRFPEQGRALTIGGADSTIKIEGDSSTLSALIVEKRGDKIYAYKQNEAYDVMHNGKIFNHMAELKDREVLSVKQFEVIISDPMSEEAQATSQRRNSSPQEIAKANTPISGMMNKVQNNVPLQDGRERKQTPKIPAQGPRKRYANPSFGKERHSERQSSAYRSRYSGVNSKDYKFSKLEDQVIIIVGFVLLFLLFGVLVWFLLS